MRRIIILLLILLLAPLAHAGVDGLVVKASPHDVGTTLDRLERALRDAGVNVIARVDHAKSGADVGIPLRPTQLLIFGNPKLGTQFFTSRQTAGIDLPMKALAWEDADGKVWLAYNDPAYIQARHGIADRNEVAKKMAGALDAMTDKAIAQ